MHDVYLLLGSNEGNRPRNLVVAEERIAALAGDVLLQSSVYETQAWGFKEQADFLNRALLIRSNLEAHALLNLLKQVETRMGRKESGKWGPRLIDVDILFYDRSVVDSPELKIPHLYIQERKFTLAPLAEIAADFIHPILNRSIRELLMDCEDNSQVVRIDQPLS